MHMDTRPWQLNAVISLTGMKTCSPVSPPSFAAVSQPESQWLSDLVSQWVILPFSPSTNSSSQKNQQLISRLDKEPDRKWHPAGNSGVYVSVSRCVWRFPVSISTRLRTCVSHNYLRSGGQHKFHPIINIFTGGFYFILSSNTMYVSQKPQNSVYVQMKCI